MRRQLLLTLSGAQVGVLDQCPSERIKFQSIGWAILITSGIATVSMWFALYSAMGINPLLALVVAVAWGFVIMGIDRWLITSMPINGKRKFAMAVPRLVLAILLGTLISTPLVLRVFESEINAQITVIKQERASAFLVQQEHSQIGEQVTYWTNDVSNLEKVIDSGGTVAINPANDLEVQSLTKQRTAEIALQQKYYAQWQCQLYGGSGCPAGNGQLAHASQAAYESAITEVNSLTSQIQQVENSLSATDATSQKSRLTQATDALPNAQQQLSLARSRENVLQANFDAQNEQTNGLLIRLEALDQLSANNLTVDSARFLLFLLFLVIECLPVTVKLIQQPGNYEKILEAEQDRELREARQAYRRTRMAATLSGGSRRQRTGDDTDILEIFERQTRVPSPPDNQPDTDPIVNSSSMRTEPALDAQSREEDEHLSISDRALRDMQADDRISAPSDGHGGGIPLPWNDDDL
jgi:hypothetical protein